ncbi:MULTISPECIES: 50S ribosomal protein L23 [Staphylococcus]|uniref:Large ribosomal subunit protein uL23 n=3 Tax=Staphylococcus TaxID=1279 RepID=A0A9Q4D7F8_9STAP|nr:MULTISPECIES: 50S ribosomal protein L23 [Staphylococcus]ASE36684.1 50S ribosomal protein L23 [Staphylococcus pettenkoferi]EHM71725.1 ribosomal protein L23 [Staphylococcus pettenkoferi VCU012]MBX8994009.1 50S ribosomal protein L23 [Staphylococcus pettenkoferi]MCI2803391.1 50S ribosomal protein L23 [Staphylococcus pettenkoferi]MCU5745158.1 50S ribosomal protein L23 [Staphylococcus marylandisciuri]
MEARDVIKRPVITEKSSAAMAEDKYTFDVATTANKTQVKIAVEEIFDVKVDKVNIINYKPKKKRMGRYQGYTNKRRVAIVKLSEGSIDLFN